MDHPNDWMPPVFVLERELEQLTSLLDSRFGERYPEETDALRAELERAIVMRADWISTDVVRMHAPVEYLDVSSGRTNRVTIVLPWEADLTSGRVSILAPLGTALFGLRVGDAIRWSTPSGRLHVWRVLDVQEEQAS